jgi:putative FmdB family regulatory protein
MARYDYQCSECGHVQEEKHGMTETPLIICSSCKKYTCRKMILSKAPDVIGGKGSEISDYNDIHDYKPRMLRFQDGHREKYDPSKHGHRKGRGR